MDVLINIAWLPSSDSANYVSDDDNEAHTRTIRGKPLNDTMKKSKVGSNISQTKADKPPMARKIVSNNLRYLMMYL